MDFTILRVLKAHSILLLTSLALFTVGCEDDDHDEHGHEEGHTDADGFKLKDENGNEVYSQFEGAIEGAITLNVGETLELTVHFLDDDGNEIEHDGGDYHMASAFCLKVSWNSTPDCTKQG